MIELEKFDIPDNPYFTFVIDMLDVGLQLRINDVPVFTDITGGEASVEIAVNEYLLEGENGIQLIVNAMDEEEFRGHSECNISFCVRDKFEDANTRRPLWILRALPAELSTIDLESRDLQTCSSRCSHPYRVSEQSLKTFVISSIVGIDYSFPQWQWLKGPVIENNPQNFQSLLDEYKKVHAHLQNRDVDILQGYTQTKADEFTRAYHMPAVEDGERLVSLADEARRDDQSLHAFWENGMKLDIYGDGRLARIVDDDGDGPIVFLIGDGNAANVMKLAFCKNDNDQWVLIR